MIPKIIHYCWFGGAEKPEKALECMESWKKFCPDYEIIEWNESNCDISKAPLYVRQAYEAKKWAFVTDYVRLQAVYENGGIYLDTDVELIKNPDFLLENKAYFGFEDEKSINTGLGFGAEKGTPILAEIMEEYCDIPFLLPEGGYDSTTCPERNTKVFVENGLVLNNSMQVLNGGILILPSEYLCPINYFTGKMNKTENTVSIHRFLASWQTPEQRKIHYENLKKTKKAQRIDYIKHLPNMVAKVIFGYERYEKLKEILKSRSLKCPK